MINLETLYGKQAVMMQGHLGIYHGILMLHYFGRLWDKMSEEEITKQQFQKRICILLIIAIIVFILESNYLNGVQSGILEIYQKAISKG